MTDIPTLDTATTLLLVSAPDSAAGRALSGSLANTGCSLVEAEDGRSALERFRDVRPDLVLIDLQLPGGTAVDLCRALRARPEAQRTPILMLHGSSADPAVFAEACLAGATEFLEQGCPEALVGHRLRSAMGLVGERAGTSGGTPTPSAPLPHDTHGLQDLVFDSIDRTRGSDLHVAVLVLLVDEEGAGLEFDLEALLQAALTGQPGLDPMPVVRGRVHLSRDDDGNFVVVAGDLVRIHEAAKLGRSLQEDIAERRGRSGAALSGVCIGVATCPEDGQDATSLLRAASEAAHRARQEGPGSLLFRNLSTNQWVFERLTLERSLAQAVENSELRVYYQPKVDIRTRSVVGMEALVRWQHPELGMVSPAQFIPLAEESGQIVPIGAWVLEEACRQCKAWQDAGFASIRMAVNLSPVQFRQPDLLHVVTETCERVGLDPGYLELEVTESMLMQDLQQTIETLRRLKAAGVYLSIDDFGTGYSSLSYLKGFPIDALKIDRSFVRDITQNSDDAAIATSIVLLGQNLNLKVIAEGVETESQLAFLRVLQCDQIQGYLFSPPVPAADAEAFLEKLG